MATAYCDCPPCLGGLSSFRDHIGTTPSRMGRPPTKQRRDKHHFLPRFLLAHFAEADGMLRAYDKGDAWSVRRDTPKRLAHEKHLYAPEVATDSDPDPKSDAVEVWLDRQIDTPAARPIQQLAAGADLDDLTAEEHHAIADFLAVLDMRTPHVRSIMVPWFTEVARQAALDTKAVRLGLRQRGIRVTKGEVRRYKQRHAAKLAEEAGKPGWLHYLQSTRDMARANVKARAWVMLNAPAGSEFATSDLGMAKALLSVHDPVAWQPGTYLGRAHWLVPLAPTRALAIRPTAAPAPEYLSADAVTRINRQLAVDARRYVYSRSLLNLPTLFGAGDDA